MKNLPEQYRKDTIEKNETMDGKMNQLLNLLGNEQLVSTVVNV